MRRRSEEREQGRPLKALRAQRPGFQASLAWVIATLLALLGILALVVILLRE
jgi:hypothetical protein